MERLCGLRVFQLAPFVWLILILSVIATSLLFPIACCAQAMLPTPDSIVQQLENAVMDSTSANKSPDSWASVNASREALSLCGEAAVQPIAARIRTGGDARVLGQLIMALGDIRSERAIGVLLDTFCDVRFRSLRGIALNELVRQTEYAGPLSIPLTADQMRAFQEALQEPDPYYVGAVARFLAQCPRNPANERVAPIVERYIVEIRTPSSVARVMGSYVSPQVFKLNQFLLAFKFFGGQAAETLAQARLDEPDEEVKKWLTLASGAAGDETVAKEIERIIRNDPDRYVRCVAVDAYAWSAKERAVPLLKELLDDRTESEYEGWPEHPCYLIRNVASDALHGLKDEPQSKTLP